MLAIESVVGQGEVKPPKPNQNASQPSPTSSPDTSKSAPTTAPAKTESLIEITLNTSRRQVTAGSGFAIVAEIRNKSDQAVYLHPKYLTLIPPPEINTIGSYWYAEMPPDLDEPLDPKGATDNYEKVIYLAPGSKTSAYWVGYGQREKENSRWWKPRFLSLVSFAPGEYNMKVVGSYWTDPEDARQKKRNYRSESAEVKVLLAAPQSVILLGAIVGGLIAYFLLPNIRLHPQEIDLTGLVTAILLSSIVTILLARLSETQFLIRVTINDFWGAIAIGFIASAWGTSIIQRFIPSRSESDRTPRKKLTWLGRRKGKKSSKETNHVAGDATPK